MLEAVLDQGVHAVVELFEVTELKAAGRHFANRLAVAVPDNCHCVR